MAILPLSKENFDVVTLELHPKRTFSSSSAGVTGSVYVFAERSVFTKEAFKLTSFDDSTVDASSIEDFRSAVFASSSETTNSYENMKTYLDKVSSTAISNRLLKQMEVLRFEPTNKFTGDTLRKSVITNTLFTYYKTVYPTTNFAYNNYHCLNFFTGAMVPTCSALIYPSPCTREDSPKNNLNLNEGFTFSFFVNPRKSVAMIGDDHKPGTIMHMSSCYAISLVTGSHVGRDNKPDKFRVLLQLSHSADIAPSEINLNIANNTRTFPQDLIFLSDETVDLNQWNHISVTWGATHNSKTGSFWFGGTEEETSQFIINSSSINNSTKNIFNPLFIGNYYNGRGKDDDDFNWLNGYFNNEVSYTEGIYDGDVNYREPSPGFLHHPLNAEIHDVKIYNTVQTRATIYSSSFAGADTTAGMNFYLPPFFQKQSPVRSVITTPFQSTRRATETPFNVELAYGVDGRDVNLQNYCRDMATGIHPRLYFLTSSTITASTGEQAANEFLWESASFAPMVRARNLLVFPCDNGNFSPNFNLLKSGSWFDPPTPGSPVDRFVNDLGQLDLTLISLRNMISTSSIIDGLSQTNTNGDDDTSSTGILQEILGSSPESPGVASAGKYTILQRTRDNTSNEIVIFDASNLFYGMMINPGTVKIRDTAVTGSGGELSVLIKDDKSGNLYRADSLSKVATWNSVGNVLYEEGIFIIKTPQLPYFGKNSFEIEFEGLQNIHTLEVNVPARLGKLNSSSNPSFNNDIIPSSYANAQDHTFVGISGVLLHDDNLNVIGRANLAQPVIKSQSDKYMFRIKIDF